MPDISQPRTLSVWERIIKLENFFQENKDKSFYAEYEILRRGIWRGLFSNSEYLSRMEEILSVYLKKEMEKNFADIFQALKDTK